MKALKLFTSVVFIVFAMSSCMSSHYGMMTGSAALSSNNFKMIKVASGTASATKVFGIGKKGDNTLMLRAKKDMMQNYPLKDGQALANMTTDTSLSGFLIFMTETITVTADIVEFK